MPDKVELIKEKEEKIEKVEEEDSDEKKETKPQVKKKVKVNAQKSKISGTNSIGKETGDKKSDEENKNKK